MMTRILKKICGMVACAMLFFSFSAITSDCLAKPTKTSQIQSKKNPPKNKSAHYVIIYKDEYDRKVTFNTYAKSKDEARHNLYQTRKVKKILNVTKK